jgi:hypothetical protein
MTPESAGVGALDDPDDDGAASPDGAASGGGQATAASTPAGCEAVVSDGGDGGSTLASPLGELSGFGSSVDIVARTHKRLVHKSPAGSGKWRAGNLAQRFAGGAGPQGRA